MSISNKEKERSGSDKVEKNHKVVAEKIETAAMGLGLTSGIVAAGAHLVAPTGLSAVGVALGLVHAPLIVVAAPIVGAVATAVGAVSAGAYFYSKWKTKKTDTDSQNENKSI